MIPSFFLNNLVNHEDPGLIELQWKEKLFRLCLLGSSIFPFHELLCLVVCQEHFYNLYILAVNEEIHTLLKISNFLWTLNNLGDGVLVRTIRQGSKTQLRSHNPLLTPERNCFSTLNRSICCEIFLIGITYNYSIDFYSLYTHFFKSFH